MTTIDHTLWIVAPVIARSAIHHLYHKLCHHLIHKAGHKFGVLGLAMRRCKWIADALLVGCLAVFGLATEHETKETE